MRSVVAFVRIPSSKRVYKTIAIILGFSAVAAALILGAAYATGGGDDPSLPTPQQHELTVDIDGIGKVELSPPGNPTVVNWLPGRKYITYATATTVSFEAKKVDSTSKWVFREWRITTSSGTTTTTSLTMQQLISGRVTVKAIFDEPAPDTDPDEWFELTTSVSPNGAVIAECSVEPVETTRHPKDASVSLVPTAANGWRFKEWQGTNAADVVTSGDTHTISMTANKSVTAVFEQPGFTLTLKTEGKGSVAASPSGPFSGSSPYQTTTITPTNSASGWTFNQWKGDLTGNANPKYNFLMDSNKTVTAVFTKSGVHSLTVTTPKGCKTRVTSSSTITGSNTNPLPEGTTVLQLASAGNVTLELLPADSPASTKLYFLKWQGDVTTQQEVQNPVTISVSGSKSIRGVAGRAYKLNLRIVGEGSVAVTADPPKLESSPLAENEFVAGTLVTLSATPTENFVRYLGSIKRTAEHEVTFTMDSTKWILARFKIGANANPYVHINSLSVRNNTISVTCWAPNNGQGTLTLTLKGTQVALNNNETPYQGDIVSESKLPGTHTYTFNFAGFSDFLKLKVLSAKWVVAGSNYYDSTECNFVLLYNTINNTWYNTPDENGQVCQSLGTFTSVCGANSQCTYSIGAYNLHSFFFAELLENGTGRTTSGNYLHRADFCITTRDSNHNLRFPLPQACAGNALIDVGGTIGATNVVLTPNADVAVDIDLIPSSLVTLGETMLHFVGLGDRMARDICPACDIPTDVNHDDTKIDHVASPSDCNVVPADITDCPVLIVE